MTVSGQDTISAEYPVYGGDYFIDWVRTWDDPGILSVRNLAVSDVGSIFLNGSFNSSVDDPLVSQYVDFDPGPGIYEMNGYGDFFLKFTQAGDFTDMGIGGNGIFGIDDGPGDELYSCSITAGDGSPRLMISRTRNLSTPTQNICLDVSDIMYDTSATLAVDEAGNIFVAGEFSGTTDFDPGSGYAKEVAYHSDVFLCKFDQRGDFLWVRTWGAEEPDWTFGDTATGIATDSDGCVYVIGKVAEPVDTNPLGSNFISKLYIRKYSPDGDLIWERGWTGENPAMMHVRDIAVTGEGDVYFMGYSHHELYPATDGTITDIEHTGNSDNRNFFLVKFDQSGTQEWLRTWFEEAPGEGMLDLIRLVADSENNVYIAGNFAGYFSMKPGFSSHLVISKHEFSDGLVFSYDPDGAFRNAYQLNNDGDDTITDMAIDSDNRVILCGTTGVPSDDRFNWTDYPEQAFLLRLKDFS